MVALTMAVGVMPTVFEPSLSVDEILANPLIF
jgi:hypothetical protein